jgi:uncharacterized protein (TIGR03067 family)
MLEHSSATGLNRPGAGANIAFMKNILIAAIALALGAQAVAQQPKATNPAAALQGTWVVASINGQAPPEGMAEMTLTFSGEKYSSSTGATVDERGTFAVDGSKKPMTVDLVIVEGTDAGKTQLGIFEVTGDTLRLNLDTPGAGQRPAEFTIKDTGVMVVAKKKA